MAWSEFASGWVDSGTVGSALSNTDTMDVSTGIEVHDYTKGAPS